MKAGKSCINSSNKIITILQEEHEYKSPPGFWKSFKPHREGGYKRCEDKFDRYDKKEILSCFGLPNFTRMRNFTQWSLSFPLATLKEKKWKRCHSK